jgi:hypothetical protein
MTAETGIENTSTSQINISPKGSRKASPSRIETIPLIAARLSQLPCMVSQINQNSSFIYCFAVRLVAIIMHSH